MNKLDAIVEAKTLAKAEDTKVYVLRLPDKSYEIYYDLVMDGETIGVALPDGSYVAKR
jgi:hypothetical protein